MATEGRIAVHTRQVGPTLVFEFDFYQDDEESAGSILEDVVTHIAKTKSIRDVQVRLDCCIDETLDYFAGAFEEAPDEYAHVIRMQFIHCSCGAPTLDKEMARLVRASKTLRKLLVHTIWPIRGVVEALVSAVADHPTLETVGIERVDGPGWDLMCALGDDRPLLDTLEEERMMLSEVLPDPMSICIIPDNNWRFQEFLVWRVGLGGKTSYELSPDSSIRERNRALCRKNVHRILADYCVAILPLRMSAYETLWLLDWLPPLHHRFVHGGVNTYDPRHVQKVRLIEGLIRSYRAIRATSEPVF